MHEEEQIEYPKSCPVKHKSPANEVLFSDSESDSPEYVYDNEEQDEAKEQGSQQ